MSIKSTRENLNITKQLIKKEKELLYLHRAVKSILRSKTFEEAAWEIFDYCIGVIGARSGYIALLSDDGLNNEVVFLEAEENSCTVDENLPMPIRGLRSIAYNTQKTVYENNFMKSEWIKFLPEGHVKLKNVLFAPMIVQDQAMGVLGIANKNSSFTEEDKELATKFAEIAAIALIKFRG